MSKAHPNNGPSFSAAAPKKRKPITDEELADRQARKAAELEQTIRDAAILREFQQRARKEGGLAAFKWLQEKNNN